MGHFFSKTIEIRKKCDIIYANKNERQKLGQDAL